MLQSLHIKNLALIREEEIEFSDGLNILTGETGAGKSVVIGSVNLALGARADAGVIRTGEESALIELVFSLNESQMKAIFFSISASKSSIKSSSNSMTLPQFVQIKW